MRKCLAILLALPLLLLAQYDTAAVLGAIDDPTGAMVSGAQVTIENTQTGIKQSMQTHGTRKSNVSLVPGN